MAVSWSTLDGRRRALVLVVGAAVLLAFGGWLATLLIESPQEAAAKAAAPEPSLITVPVESREVGDELVTRGLVTAAQTVEAITPLAGKNAQRALISGRVPQTGDEVKAGSVIIEISGRPVIALQADVPAYRDLGPGDSGSDVQRLNAALARAGFSVSSSSSDYDDATKDAVEALYRKAGYASGGGLAAGEVAFVSALPASVVQVSAALGAESGAASVRIASGELTITAEFPPGQAELVRPGAKVVISSEMLGESIDATVKASTAGGAANEPDQGQPSPGGDDPEGGEDEAPLEESDNEEAPATGFAIVPNKPLPSSWAGQDVRVRVVSATTGKNVLAVPVTAIVSSGSGDTEVVVVKKGATSITDADPQRVRVKVGVTGGGWTEITPEDDDLSEGDLVQLSAALKE